MEFANNINGPQRMTPGHCFDILNLVENHPSFPLVQHFGPWQSTPSMDGQISMKFEVTINDPLRMIPNIFVKTLFN